GLKVCWISFSHFEPLPAHGAVVGELDRRTLEDYPRMDPECRGAARSRKSASSREPPALIEQCCDSSSANREFPGTTVPGHSAQTVPVLGRIVRTAFVPFAPSATFFGGFARAVFLPAHYESAGHVGAMGHFLLPVPSHFERTVRARPVPAHLFRPTKLGIA